MKSIEVKFLAATDTKPARIKAFTDGSAVTLSWDYEHGLEQNAVKAAKVLKDRLGWTAEMVGGHTKNGFVFVFIDNNYRIA